jgi:hypothetical protein
MKRLLILALVGLTLAGCGHYLTTAECLTIHDMAGLSDGDFKRVDADPNMPAYAKTMFGGNALAWNNLDARINNKGAVDANSYKPKTAK